VLPKLLAPQVSNEIRDTEFAWVVGIWGLFAFCLRDKPWELTDRMLPGVLSGLILQAFETAALEGTRN